MERTLDHGTEGLGPSPGPVTEKTYLSINMVINFSCVGFLPLRDKGGGGAIALPTSYGYQEAHIQ